MVQKRYYPGINGHQVITFFYKKWLFMGKNRHLWHYFYASLRAKPAAIKVLPVAVRHKEMPEDIGKDLLRCGEAGMKPGHLFKSPGNYFP